MPEIASRRHLELVVPVIDAALADAGATLADIESVAVTQGPGLIGALLVGLSTAKALAYSRGLPLVPVDHLLGHIAALRLAPLELEPPFACVLASGGHTLVLDVADYALPIRLGGTRDDAAGEAFDKGARLLGLSDAGGAALEALAREGDPRASRSRTSCAARAATTSRSPASRRRSCTPSATSATASPRCVPTSPRATRPRSCGSSSSAPRRRSTHTGHATLAIVGGVAANGALRSALTAACEARGARLCLLPPALCVDNAAMIAAAALAGRERDAREFLALDAYARSPLAG